jgi:hypothetical protein
MAFKIGKVMVQTIIIALLVAILVILLTGRRSAYEPSPIVSAPGPHASAQPKSIFDLPNSLSCVAGPEEKAGYYSQGLTPGGICGSGEYVRDALHDYTIEDGIGGSLLAK